MRSNSFEWVLCDKTHNRSCLSVLKNCTGFPLNAISFNFIVIEKCSGTCPHKFMTFNLPILQISTEL